MNLAEYIGGDLPQSKVAELKRLLSEKVRRQMEALKLYKPLPTLELFHQSMAKERILRGSNRSGKTLGASIEVGRATTGTDPYNKYPLTDGRCFCVAKDGKEIGQVMWRKLFKPGAFWIIRDKQTKRWRAFRPWDAEDAKRKHLRKPAPPIIPPRLVKHTAWENKKLNQPSMVTLRNGWEISFFTSLSKPVKGADVDLVWFDEEIEDSLWYPEMRSRRFDRGGRFIWSATPEAGTDQLYDLSERAASQLKLPKEQREIEEFVTLLDDNIHFSDADKKSFAAGFSDDERRVKIGGEFAIASFRIYPEFSMTVHGVNCFPVPKEWCRYAAVDPGHDACAVVFAAIPPPTEDNKGTVYVYDELYIVNCDADKFGAAMKAKAEGQVIQAFLIDHMAGRQTAIGSGMTTEMHYSEALRRHGVASVATGHNFWWGSPDVEAGILAVKDLLRVRQDGEPRLRLLKDVTGNLQEEMRRYRRRKDPKSGRPAEPNNRAGLHEIDCLRYLAAQKLVWVKPKAGRGHESGVLKALAAKRKKAKEQGGPAVMLGPCGGKV